MWRDWTEGNVNVNFMRRKYEGLMCEKQVYFLEKYNPSFESAR